MVGSQGIRDVDVLPGGSRRRGGVEGWTGPGGGVAGCCCRQRGCGFPPDFSSECPGQQHHLNQIKPTHPHAEEVPSSREQRSGQSGTRKVWDKSDKSVCSIEHNLALRSELHR